MALLGVAVVIVGSLLKMPHAIQPSAKNPIPNQQFRNIEWGDLNFVHTTDMHGWIAGHDQEPQYSADFGDYISFVSHMRERADKKGVDLLVIDTGDRAECNGLWDSSVPEGKYVRRIVQQLDLDILTIGNHELYSETTAHNEKQEMVSWFGDRYLSSNVDIYINNEWMPFAKRVSKIITKNQRLRITAFGFMYNMEGTSKNTRVKPVGEVLQEDWFLKAISDRDVDLFLVAAHMEVYAQELRQIHRAIRAANSEVPIQFFAGHTHIRNFEVFDKKSTALQSGSNCETVGWLSLSGLIPKNSSPKPKDGGSLTITRRYIDFNRVGFQLHSGTNDFNFDTTKGLQLTSDIGEYRQELDLNRVIGYAPRDFTLFRDKYPSSGNWLSFLAEHVLPEMVYNKERHKIPHMIFVNGGSQRSDVFKGPFMSDTIFPLSPFTSRFYYAKDIKYSVASQLFDHLLNDPKLSMIKPNSRGTLSSPPETGTKNEFSRTVGYTTKDKYGTLGDDTVHEYVERYLPPDVIQSKVSFPDNHSENPPAVVDVVFVDYLVKSIANGLNTITGNKDQYRAQGFEGFERYMDPEYTLTKLLLDYVDKHWNSQGTS